MQEGMHPLKENCKNWVSTVFLEKLHLPGVMHLLTAKYYIGMHWEEVFANDLYNKIFLHCFDL